jgi:pyruvate formate lyase activating enzyme
MAERNDELLNLENVKESPLYEELAGGEVRCGVCERRCFLHPGQLGFCKTKKNVNGKLYTLVYGDINAMSANPIEKKPFFHFYPGSIALTFSTWSCNFTCPWCQNWTLSKTSPNPWKTEYISPRKMVDIALRQECNGISVSFTEPTLLFEYSLDVFPLAREKGLYNNFVSNGYMTDEALKMLKEAGMNAIKFDLKGDEESVKAHCNADVNVVWRNVRRAKELGMHVEVVNLVITSVNDDEACLRSTILRHLKEAGPDVPLHFTQYYPAYKFTKPKTTVKTLEKAYNMAKAEGVRYPYIGNVPGHEYENTYCPECGELLIKRWSFSVVKYKITPRNACPKCGEHIPITGRYVRSKGLFWPF